MEDFNAARRCTERLRQGTMCRIVLSEAGRRSSTLRPAAVGGVEAARDSIAALRGEPAEILRQTVFARHAASNPQPPHYPMEHLP